MGNAVERLLKLTSLGWYRFRLRGGAPEAFAYRSIDATDAANAEPGSWRSNAAGG
jgi:hypothetical protein